MAGVASTSETEREGKESNKYLLSIHHMPDAVCLIMNRLQALRALCLEKKNN